MLYSQKEELVLASGSPRRRELLGSTGLTFKVVVPGSDESILDGESPEQMVKRLALIKAGEVAKERRRAWVIGADTTVSVDGKALGKPGSIEEAKWMLRLIQGRTHEVLGGFAVINLDKGFEHVESCSTKVTMNPLSDEQISAYVRTGEPLDKAGAYAAQGIGAAFISRIEGSYTNVVGLPLSHVLSVLSPILTVAGN